MNHPAQDQGVKYWSDGDADIPVFQRPNEFERLLELYDRIRPRKVLEIGTYYGGTLKQWICRMQDGLVVSVDNYAAAGADNSHLLKDMARENSVSLKILRGDSADNNIVKSAGCFAPYDWIFIDGCHMLPAVTDDWTNYGPMGKVVVFHDILHHPNHTEIQVYELWNRIVVEGYATEEIIEDRSAEWGGYGIVYMS